MKKIQKLNKYIPLAACIIAAVAAYNNAPKWIIIIWALAGGLWALWDMQDLEQKIHNIEQQNKENQK